VYLGLATKYNEKDSLFIKKINLLGKLDANVGPSREAKTTPQKAN
jgi:hypothetical protein